MVVNRAHIVDGNFRSWLQERAKAPWQPQSRDLPVRAGSSLVGWTALELFESQMTCRQLDLAARELKARNVGYYTIGSAGHEGNAAVGRALRHTDPAFLHYRSGAFVAERSRHLPGSTPIFDVLLSLVASREDPISGGRHKVFGSRPLWIPPQTSTIASHLPKAVGCAFMLERCLHLGEPVDIPEDAIVACSFGDASVNHNVAQGAFNAAGWAAHQSLPLPVLFICEDNGCGISVKTPEGWIGDTFRQRPDVDYFAADGLDLADAWDVASEAVDHCRMTRRPTFLHLRTVRLLGHAGSDVETEYRSREEIEEAEARDPLLASARLLVEEGVIAPAEILGWYDEIAARVAAAADEAATRPQLETAAQVIEPLAPHHEAEVAREAQRRDFEEERTRVFGGEGALPERSARPRHLAVQINRGLTEGLAKYSGMVVFGEDVAKKGGVYHVTEGLMKKAGVGRVFNTLLDETTILGVAIGAGHLGLLPVPEIQYLAYYHNAEDQIRGEAASLQFFSRGQFRNPMVVRIASFGYQKGFGGHFHNDNSIAVLRDVPGLVIAAPSRGDDAVGMLRTALAMAKVDGAVVAFLEPIALYMTKDLHEPGDGLWLTEFPAPGEAVPVGKGRVWDAAEGDDLTIISYANGFYLSRQAAKVLREEHGVATRVVDLRWLAPLDEALVCEQARATGKVLIVDEGRRSAGMSEPLYTLLLDRLSPDVPRVSRICAEDTFVPIGPAANAVMPSRDTILEAALELVGRGSEMRESSS